MRITFETGEECWAEVWGQLTDLDERVQQAVLEQWFLALAELLCGIESCESPIEQLMLVHLITQLQLLRAHTGWNYVIWPQHQFTVGNRRVRLDFHVTATGPDGRKVSVAVECDGHDYHERTKEQAAADRSRDRLLLASGIPVVRFTGTEIWKDPNACAREVRTVLERLIKQAG